MISSKLYRYDGGALVLSVALFDDFVEFFSVSKWRRSGSVREFSAKIMNELFKIAKIAK